MLYQEVYSDYLDLIPAALMLSIFSYQILLLWTKNIRTAQNVYPVVSLLAIGTLLNLLATMPGQLQIADGRTRIMVYINAASILFILPLNIWLGQVYRGVGVAFVWIMLNVLYLFAGIYIVHPQLLNENKIKWIWEDIVKPFLFVAIFIGASKYIYISCEPQNDIAKIGFMSAIFIMSYIVNMYALDTIKQEIFKLIKVYLVRLKNQKNIFKTSY